MGDQDRKDRLDVRSKIAYPSRSSGAQRKQRRERQKPILFVLWLIFAAMLTLDIMSGFKLLTWRDRLYFLIPFILSGYLTGVFQLLWNHLRFERLIRKNRGPRRGRD